MDIIRHGRTEPMGISDPIALRVRSSADRTLLAQATAGSTTASSPQASVDDVDRQLSNKREIERVRNEDRPRSR